MTITAAQECTSWLPRASGSDYLSCFRDFLYLRSGGFSAQHTVDGTLSASEPPTVSDSVFEYHHTPSARTFNEAVTHALAHVYSTQRLQTSLSIESVARSWTFGSTRSQKKMRRGLLQQLLSPLSGTLHEMNWVDKYAIARQVAQEPSMAQAHPHAADPDLQNPTKVCNVTALLV